MNFTSMEFILLFPVVLLFYWILPARVRWILLLAASYYFYMDWNLPAGLLLLVVTAVTYFAALRIEKGRHRKFWLAFAFGVCLGSLGVFKYTGFFMENITAAAGMLTGRQFDVTVNIILPAGISFYTFQTLSYVADVYQGREACEKHFGYYALFVSFFPQLVAGPIERCGNLLHQLKKTQKFSRKNLADGIWLMVRGFFKKLVVADFLGMFADQVYGEPKQASGLAVILGTVFFAVQIYCDFSGYTDIARGTARMMGVSLMENFDHPYRATDIRDFWRRWHISLTGWFRDYVYIPLGGSRRGLVRQCRNTLIVFGLSGLWHGASWNYVLWGLYHGILLTAEILRKRLFPAFGRKVIWGNGGKACGDGCRTICGKTAGRFVTFILVCAGWILFRSRTLKEAGILFGQIWGNFAGNGLSESLSAMGLTGIRLVGALLVILAFLLLERLPERISERIRENNRKLAIYTFLCVCMVLAAEYSWFVQRAAGGGNSFIYFRF